MRMFSAAAARLAIVASCMMALGGCVTQAGKASRIVKANGARAVIAVTTEGPIQGASSRDGTVFLGIPFAAPPVGALRFAPPQPAAARSETRPATTLGSACPQAGQTRSEDCLTLNIYAPHDAAASGRLPVMVWLHGGGLKFGSNANYDGSRLAERQRVIVVVPNYRLGAFGFLAHPALRGAGEGGYGILDQRAALHWIRRNIAAFGGDPSRVTLFGESAGATSACTHMVSPGSRGLFHRVILQSDTCIFPDQSTSRDEAERGGTEMARALGCTDPATALACLRALPVKALLKAKSARWGNGGANSWSPMVGGDVLPLSPRQVFASGDAAQVPLLMGSNRDEGRLFSNILAAMGTWIGGKGYDRMVAKAMRPDVRPAALAEYADAARRSRYRAFADMLTDAKFACPMLTLHRLRAGRAPDYVYEFDDPDAPTLIPNVPFAPRQRSFHAAELMYVFQHRLLLGRPGSWRPDQRALADRMQRAWASFAATGHPGAGDPDVWPAFDGARPLHLSPGATGPVEDFATRHRCAFWNARGY